MSRNQYYLMTYFKHQKTTQCADFKLAITDVTFTLRLLKFRLTYNPFKALILSNTVFSTGIRCFKTFGKLRNTTHIVLKKIKKHL